MLVVSFHVNGCGIQGTMPWHMRSPKPFRRGLSRLFLRAHIPLTQIFRLTHKTSTSPTYGIHYRFVYYRCRVKTFPFPLCLTCFSCSLRRENAEPPPKGRAARPAALPRFCGLCQFARRRAQLAICRIRRRGPWCRRLLRRLCGWPSRPRQGIPARLARPAKPACRLR